MKFKHVVVLQPVQVEEGLETPEALSGAWKVRETLGRKLEVAAQTSAQRNDPAPLKEVIELVSKVGENLRYVGCNHEIFDLYSSHILAGILDNSGRFGAGFSAVVEQIDRTEIYHNMGVVKAQEEDFDTALQCFGDADKEHAKRSGAPVGTYLRALLDDADSPLWNFSENIRLNCSTFIPAVFGPYEFSGAFGRDMTIGEMKALLKDLEPPLLLQFLHTVLTFWKVLVQKHNLVRFVRMSRIVGELSYLLDCYISKQPVCAGLGGLFDRLKQLVLADGTVKAEFDRVHTLIGGHTVDATRANAQLTQLATLIEGEPHGPKKWAYCMLVAHRVRNYSSHDLDDQFILNSRQDMTKKLFLAILMAFFVCRKLLGVWTP